MQVEHRIIIVIWSRSAWRCQLFFFFLIRRVGSDTEDAKVLRGTNDESGRLKGVNTHESIEAEARD